MGKYFGTDGFRGAVNEELTALHAYKVGRFLGYTYNQTKDGTPLVVIGRDTRLSGQMLEAGLIAGITSSGANVVLSGIMTTPGVAYLSSLDEYDFGIMISASHNPFYDNGIKVFNAKGHKVSHAVEKLIEEYIDTDMDVIPLVDKKMVGKIIEHEDVHRLYLNHLKATIDGDLTGLEIGIDASNGATYKLAQMLFESLNAKVHVIHNTPNGYNINENCGSTSPESLQKYVVDNNLDFGLAFDGDADRLIAVDNLGEIVDGDRIIYLLAKQLKAKDKLIDNTVVVTVMSNLGLLKAFDQEEIKYEIVQVGDKYVSEKMFQSNYVIGGEQSGHIILKDFATTGDGMLSALQLASLVKESNQKLSDLTSEVISYPQLLVNVKVDDKDEIMDNDNVKITLEKIEKLLKNEGRILLRPSGTEPLIRVMVEASNIELCEQSVAMMVETIKKVLDK